MAIIVERGLAFIRNIISPFLYFLGKLCFILSIISILAFVGAVGYAKFGGPAPPSKISTNIAKPRELVDEKDKGT